MTAQFPLMRKIALAAGIMLLAAACSNQYSASLRSITPIPEALRAEMSAKGMPRTSPILVRIYKKESELELWKQTSSGRFALLKTYPICRWSGQLGPKKVEGDRQVPEGFYQVSQSQLNPNSKYYLSFDVGYPNNFDRQLGRAGGDIMVHGSCSSRGCFAMTDNQMAEIYAVAREALQAGQPAFQLQSYPFRMTAENMAKNRRNPNIGFWQNLKQGSDNFEVTKQAVKVDVCKGNYVFNGDGGSACGIAPANPSIAAAVYDKKRQDEAQIATLIKSGTKAVSYIYEDGGSNPIFATRSVDQTSIPGKDRPYSNTEVTVVSLNDNGMPASETDAQAAKRVTYSAAEALLMSEAAVARQPINGPVDSGKVSLRQQSVYARLMGSSLPVPPAPKPQPVVVAAKSNPADAASVVQVAAVMSTDNSQPFYSRWLGLGGNSPQTQTTQLVASPIASAQATQTHAGARRQVMASAVPVKQAPSMPAAPAVAPAEQPFYSRWLGLGADSSQAQSAQPASSALVSAQAPQQRVAVGKPVMASAAPVSQVASMPAAPATAPAEQSFYKRWLGFADDNTASTGAN
jgi:murein L,D-transpeptidase YafK